MNTQTQEALKMAQEVSLIELLRSVPENARLIVDSADGMSSRYHPVGYLCHKAAEALESQEVAQLNDEYLRDTYVKGLSQEQEPVMIEDCNAARQIKEWREKHSQEQEPCHCGNPTFNIQKITHTKNRCFEKHNDDIYGWVNSYGDMNLGSHKPEFQGDDWVAVYLHPAPAWQGLSNDDIANIIGEGAFYEYDDMKFARVIEQALKEKNHG